MRLILASLISVFVCLMAMGQAFTPLRPFIPSSSGSFIPSDISPTYWWVSSDLATQAVVTAWTDRIQGKVLSGSGGTEPYTTNSSDGVWFAGGQKLVLSPPIPFYNPTLQADCLVLIYKPYTPSDTRGALIDGDNNLGTTGGYGIYTYSDNTMFSTFAGVADHFGSYQNNIRRDVAWNTISAGGGNAYTNGVLVESGANVQGPLFLGMVGNDPVSPFRYIGSIYEIMVWTNSLTTNQIANLHTYATNTYNYVP